MKIVTVSELESQVRNEKSKADELFKENEVLKDLCEDLYNRMVELRAKEKKASQNLVEANTNIDNLMFESRKLHSYIEKLGQDIGFENSGKTIAQVGKRQQRKKLKELKTHVDHALWFAKTFGFKFSCFFRARMARAIHCSMMKTK